MTSKCSILNVAQCQPSRLRNTYDTGRPKLCRAGAALVHSAGAAVSWGDLPAVLYGRALGPPTRDPAEKGCCECVSAQECVFLESSCGLQYSSRTTRRSKTGKEQEL